MRTKILVVALLSSFASLSFAASNVTLYGQLDEGLVVGKAKHSSTTATLKSGFVGMSRWGIKGVEDLGNGYSVGFTLEQGFLADSGAEHTSGLAFSRESLMRITGPFGQVAFGRMGPLALLSQLPSSVDGHSALHGVPALGASVTFTLVV